MTTTPTKLNPWYSLKAQLILGAIVMLTITLGSISYFLLVHEKYVLIAEIEKTTIFQGRNIALGSEKALLRSDPEFELFPRVKRILSRSASITSVVITDADGVIHGDSELANISQPYQFDTSGFKAKSNPLLVADEALYDDKDSIVLRTPIRSLGKVIGHVHFGYSKRDLNRSISRAITITMICGMLAFGLGIILALLLFRRIADPVNTLVTGARRIGEGHLDTKIELRSKSELSVLADSFNDMATKIALTQEELISKERMEAELEIAHDIQSTLIPTESFKTE
ncbi:MAG: HAMP domain-containing protein, partial [Gammaproteobacteria bacterium]|nr:HAMP domain-containing protein [Gammaproteobacteria bacterium]